MNNKEANDIKNFIGAFANLYSFTLKLLLILTFFTGIYIMLLHTINIGDFPEIASGSLSTFVLSVGILGVFIVLVFLVFLIGPGLIFNMVIPPNE